MLHSLFFISSALALVTYEVKFDRNNHKDPRLIGQYDLSSSTYAIYYAKSSNNDHGQFMCAGNSACNNKDDVPVEIPLCLQVDDNSCWYIYLLPFLVYDPINFQPTQVYKAIAAAQTPEGYANLYGYWQSDMQYHVTNWTSELNMYCQSASNTFVGDIYFGLEAPVGFGDCYGVFDRVYVDFS